MNKWDRNFLNLACLISTWSKDPSTKVGAVAVDRRRRVISHGYNGFPQGIKDDSRLHNRDDKYALTIHAEMNVILNCVTSLRDSVLYTFPLAPCEKCAIILVQTGIRRIVAPKLSAELVPRWACSTATAREIFEEAGVKLDTIQFRPTTVILESTQPR